MLEPHTSWANPQWCLKGLELQAFAQGRSDTPVGRGQAHVPSMRREGWGNNQLASQTPSAF